MGTVILNQINQPVLADMQTTDIVNVPFAAVQIDPAASAIDVWGIDISIFCFDTTDYARILGVEVLLQRNLKLDAAIKGDSQGIPGNLQWYRIFRDTTNNYERTWNFTTPILLQSNTPYAVWTFLRAVNPAVPGFVGLTREVITVRGVPRGSQNFPYTLR